MLSPRTGSPTRSGMRRLSLLASVAVLGLIPATGCQVEYAGMTLPSGKYMRDDVQYFAPGPDFPWANTQAATQRARMSQMGIAVPPVGAPAPPVIVPAQGGGGANILPLNMAPQVPNPNPVAPPLANPGTAPPAQPPPPM
jgi:hypothetical protein